jgi:hypothetical protein
MFAGAAPNRVDGWQRQPCKAARPRGNRLRVSGETDEFGASLRVASGEETDDEVATRRNVDRQRNRHEYTAAWTRTALCSPRHPFLSAVELLQYGGAAVRLTTRQSLNRGIS